MKHIGEAIGFSALVAAAVVLECKGYNNGGVWIMIFLWYLYGFDDSKDNNNNN